MDWSWYAAGQGAELALIWSSYFFGAFILFIFSYAFIEYLIMKSRGE